MFYSIGIIAADNERIKKIKWYNFIRKTKPDYYLCPHTGIRFVIAYEKQNITKIFKEEGISVAIVSKSCRAIDIEEIFIANGAKAYLKHIPFAVRKITKEMGILNQDSIVAVIDDKAGIDAVILLDKLQQSHRYLTLVTEDIEKANVIAKNMLDEYGIAITIAGFNETVNCHVAVNLSQMQCDLPKNTVVFDLFGGHNIANNGKVINNFRIAPKIKLPIPVYNLAVIEAMEALGIEKISYKPVGFLYDENQINLFDI